MSSDGAKVTIEGDVPEVYEFNQFGISKTSIYYSDMLYVVEYHYGADGMLLTSISITDGIDGYIESVTQYTYDVSSKDWEKRFYEDRYRGTVITERTIEYW